MVVRTYLKAGQTPEIPQQAQESAQSYNLQYLGLQNQMAYEDRQYAILSNLMSNKHDTAENSIGNIR